MTDHTVAQPYMRRTREILSGRVSDPFTQADARQLSKLLPFRQVLGIKNVLNAMVGRFPEE